MKVIGIIPARYASTRFPAKPLAVIDGVSMIQRVYNQVLKAKAISEVIVATDHHEIFQHVKFFGGQVVMTDESLPSGTDRVYQAYQRSGLEADVVVNIQGDEPFIAPDVIDLLADSFNSESVLISTAATKIFSEESVFEANVVKVVFDKHFRALYFSRSPIPFLRGKERNEWIQNADFYKHIGIYAYRVNVLQSIVQLPVSGLENLESLEQLRWLENGFHIKINLTEYDSFGIDTPNDLQEAIRLLKLNS